MKGLILVVEDELLIQRGLKNFLEDAGYQVDTASDGLEGAYKGQQKKYDLILLDVMMPKLDGYSVLKIIRETSSVPVIMLTALDTEENQVKGFELQVDDYISKPFSMTIVLKRIEALLRRSTMKKETKPHQILSYKDIVLDLKNYEVKIADVKLSLTDTEYEVLKLLIEHSGEIFTRENLLNKIWGEDFFGSDHVVSVHVANLRKKMGREYIETVRGRGYRIAYEDKT